VSTHDLPPFDPVAAAEALRPGADRAELRAALAAALGEIERLQAGLRWAAEMKTIKGARVIVADTLGPRQPEK